MPWPLGNIALSMAHKKTRLGGFFCDHLAAGRAVLAGTARRSVPSLLARTHHLHGRCELTRHLGHVARHDERGLGVLGHFALSLHGLLGHFQLHRLFAAIKRPPQPPDGCVVHAFALELDTPMLHAGFCWRVCAR